MWRGLAVCLLIHVFCVDVNAEVQRELELLGGVKSGRRENEDISSQMKNVIVHLKRSADS